MTDKLDDRNLHMMAATRRTEEPAEEPELDPDPYYPMMQDQPTETTAEDDKDEEES